MPGQLSVIGSAGGVIEEGLVSGVVIGSVSSGSAAGSAGELLSARGLVGFPPRVVEEVVALVALFCFEVVVFGMIYPFLAVRPGRQVEG